MISDKGVIMGSVGTRTLLILATILVIVSVFGTYMAMTKIQFVPAASMGTGIVKLTILQPQKQESSPPSTSTGIVGVTILKPKS